MVPLPFLLPACRTPTAHFRLRLPSPNCFLSVCFPTLFAADLKNFLPLITAPISGAANSNMSAPMHFADGTTYLRKNGTAVLPITCASAQNPLQGSFCVSDNVLIYWIAVNHQRLDTNKVVGKFGFMRPFSYHQYPNFVYHNVTKNVTQIGATEGKTRGIVCNHKYNFLHSARNLDCYASFVVVFLS